MNPDSSTHNKNSPAATSPVTSSTQSSGIPWCHGMKACAIIRSTVPHLRENSLSKLNQQVAELENEVQRQIELRAAYRMRMERTQDYLRYCLRIAQENGFLELLINKNNGDDQLPSPMSSELITTPVPTPLHPHFHLAALIDRAKANGWYIEPHEIELQEQLAQGTTADIFRGTWRGLDVAVKCIFPDSFISNDNTISFFAQELDTLSRQRHQFVLQLMGACLKPPDHCWVVTELLSTNLKEWLHGPGKRRRERTKPLPPLEKRVAKGLEISQAVNYLHAQKPMVIHRDLKPSNIFLDDSMHVRVADFGHARFLSDGEKALTGDIGTYVYMAPEVIRNEPYDEKCDVYSFAIILNELITGEHPYIETNNNPTQIALEIGEGKLRPKLPNYKADLEELIELIRVSWDEDPYVRPSFATITSKLRKVHKHLLQNLMS